jgi:hypothetical protein
LSVSLDPDMTRPFDRTVTPPTCAVAASTSDQCVARLDAGAAQSPCARSASGGRRRLMRPTP